MEALCLECPARRPAKILGLCNVCYLRAYRRRVGPCSKCSRPARDRATRGLCRPCYVESSVWLESSYRRLAKAEVPWARRLVQQFRAQARRQGFASATIKPLVLKLVREILRAGSSDPRAFAARFVASHKETVLAGEHDSGFPRTLIRFFEQKRLVAREDWGDLDAAGKMNAVLLPIPAQLRVGLDLFRRHFDEERRYRSATGEPSRSYASERSIFLILAVYASWLQANGLTSWQQLTPERFRTALRARGDNRPLSQIAADVHTLRSFLAFLVAERQLFRNPLTALRPPKVPRLLRPTADDEEIDAALQRIADPNADVTARAIAALVVLHGLTFGELGRLLVGDYQRRTRTLRLTRRRLWLSLDPITHDALVTYLMIRRAAPKQHALFVTVRTQKSGSRATSTFFAQQLQLLGIRTGGFAFRKRLLLDALRREDSLVAARLFGMSKDQIDRYFCLVAAEKLRAFQPDAKQLQDTL